MLFISILVPLVLKAQNQIEKQNKEEMFIKYSHLSKDEQFHLSERKSFALKALSLSKELNNPIDKINAYTDYGYILAQEGYYFKAFKIFDTISSISDSLAYHTQEDWRRKAFFLNIEGILYKELGIYDKSIACYYSSLKICDSLPWENGQATALNNISNLFLLQGNLKQAAILQKKALTIAKNTQDTGKIYDAYYNLMLIYSESNSLDTAHYYAKKSKEILPRLKSLYQDCFFYNDYATLLFKSSRIKDAKYYYTKALSLALENHFDELQLKAYTGLGSVAEKQQKFILSNDYLQKAIQLSDSISIPALKVEVLEHMVSLFESSHQISKAHQYLKMVLKLQDSLNSSWKTIQQSEIYNIYHLQWQEQENKILKKNLSIARLKIYQRSFMLIGSVVLLLLLLWFLIILYRKRKVEKRMSHQAQIQSETIRQQQDLIHEHREEQLEFELNAKSRQLATFSLSSIKHVQATEEIITKISQLIYNQPIKEAAKKELEQVIQQMKRDLIKSDWEEFKTYYEQVHPSFYENLISKHPDLTANEEKLCAFISLGLSNKDIASLTFRQLRSVESARLRLRKKLNIENNEHLFDYLKQF